MPCKILRKSPINFPDFYGRFVYKLRFLVLSFTANCPPWMTGETAWPSLCSPMSLIEVLTPIEAPLVWTHESIDFLLYLIAPITSVCRCRLGSNEFVLLIHKTFAPASCSGLTHCSVLISISSQIITTQSITHEGSSSIYIFDLQLYPHQALNQLSHITLQQN